MNVSAICCKQRLFIVCARLLHWSLQSKKELTIMGPLRQQLSWCTLALHNSWYRLDTKGKPYIYIIYVFPYYISYCTIQWNITLLTFTHDDYCCTIAKCMCGHCPVQHWMTFLAGWFMPPIQLQRPPSCQLRNHLVGSLHDIDLKESEMKETE